MMRILIIKTTSLGDVVHNLPVVADIKKHHPNAQIDWVVEESFADIPAMHPEVNQVIKVAIRRWRQSLFSAKTWQEIASFKQALQLTQYDVVIDTQGLLKSGLMTFLANSPRKCGYDKQSAREPIASCFYQQTYTVARNLHAVTRNRQLSAMALADAMPDTAPNYGIAANLSLALALNLPNTPYVLALHSTSRESKCWPVAHWVGLGQRMQQAGLQLLLPWGSAAEHARAQLIAQAVPQALVLPKLSIAALASVIANAQLTIGVDTGLVHLAAALNKPTIAIYTDTNPVLTGVYPPQAAAAINLGNVNTIPSPEEAWHGLTQLIPAYG